MPVISKAKEDQSLEWESEWGTMDTTIVCEISCFNWYHGSHFIFGISIFVDISSFLVTIVDPPQEISGGGLPFLPCPGVEEALVVCIAEPLARSDPRVGHWRAGVLGHVCSRRLQWQFSKTKTTTTKLYKILITPIIIQSNF